MQAQFTFFNSARFTAKTRPIMAGLNYFLTHGNRGGSGDKLLGEKKDVKVWLGWLELFANGDVTSIATPIGYLPKFEDLAKLFTAINKPYDKTLYTMQFSLYIDKIIARIDLQQAAYSKEAGIPAKLFEVYERQKAELLQLKERFGAIVTPDQLAG